MKTILITFIIGAIGLMAPHFFADSLFGHLDKGINPSNEVPWYFIYQDFRKFMAFISITSVVIFILIFFHKKLMPHSLYAIFVIMIFGNGHLVKGFFILRYCDNIFKPSIATTRWINQSEYLLTVHNYWIILPVLISFVLIYKYLDKQYKKKTKLLGTLR